MYRRIAEGAENRKAHESSQTGVSFSCILDFPAAILVEIFLKLPIYAIIRCKIVCKSWFNLLSDPYFANVYTTNPPFTTLLLSEEGCRTTRRKLIDFFLLEFSEDGNSIRTRIDPRVPDCLDAESALFVIGSSKGLLCLCERKYIPYFMIETLYISNPITGECIALPQHRVNSSDGSFILYEFGFSPSTNNFKVMRFVYTSVQPGNEKVQVEIFTVGVDCEWRCLEERSIPFSFWSEGITFNGAYHWIRFVNRNCELICTFDLGKEKAGRVIEHPALLENIGRTKLALLNNRLCLVIIKSVPSHITIWTMNEYAVDSSWTRHVILQCWFPSHLCFEELFPVAILRNGAILFKDREKICLVSCNPKRKKAAKIKVSDVEGIGVISISVNNYAPSFSSFQELMMGGEGSSVIAGSK